MTEFSKIQNKVFIFLLSFLTLIGCSKLETKKNGGEISNNVEISSGLPQASAKPIKVEDDQILRSQEAEAEKYFLPAIPQWINSSEEGDCQKEKDLLYLNFEVIKPSLGLKNKQLLNLQYFVNDLWLKKRPITYDGSILYSLLSKDKKILFDQARDQVLGGVNAFDWPISPKVLVIDWDKLLEKNRLAFFQKYLDSIYAMQGMTIIYSRCVTTAKIKSWFKENQNQVQDVIQGQDQVQDVNKSQSQAVNQIQNQLQAVGQVQNQPKDIIEGSVDITSLQSYIIGAEVLSVFSPEELNLNQKTNQYYPLQFFWTYLFDDPESFPSILWVYDEKNKIKVNSIYIK